MYNRIYGKYDIYINLMLAVNIDSTARLFRWWGKITNVCNCLNLKWSLSDLIKLEMEHNEMVSFDESTYRTSFIISNIFWLAEVGLTKQRPRCTQIVFFFSTAVKYVFCNRRMSQFWIYEWTFFYERNSFKRNFSPRFEKEVFLVNHQFH